MDVRLDDIRIKGAWGVCVRYRLRGWAKRLIAATKKSGEMRAEVMHDLPGIFALELSYGQYALRLMKEGDSFRILKKSEKSDEIVRLIAEDLPTLTALAVGSENELGALAQGRLSYLGSNRFVNVILCLGATGSAKTVVSETQEQ